MKMRLIVLVMICLLLTTTLTACGGEAPASTVPTETATVTLTPEITSEPVSEVRFRQGAPAEIYYATYTMKASIKEDMPPYRFIAKGFSTSEIRYENKSGYDDCNVAYITSLSICDENNKLLMSAEFTADDGVGNQVYNLYMDTMGLQLVDVNFDGYKDILMLQSVGGAKSSRSYSCWLWDQKRSTFVMSESFDGMTNILCIDTEKKYIYVGGSGGANHSGHSIYRFIDGKFVLSNNLDIYMKSDGIRHFVEEKRINGKMKTVRDENIKDSSSKLAIELAGYVDDGLWELTDDFWSDGFWHPVVK